MSEFDTGYSVVIGKPVVHAEKKATGSSVSFPCEAIPDGSYLVSLEVNGSVEAYRESMEFSSGSCTVGEYTLSYSSYSLTVSGTSNNDIVRVMVEPLDVKTTDAFRAAVKKDGGVLPPVTASDAGKVLSVNNSGVWGAANPSSGGGVLVVHDVDGTLDKTWQEIKDADFAVVKILTENGYVSGCVTNVGKFNTSYDVQAFEWGQDPQTLEPVASVKTYRASSADGYPVYVNE